MSSPQSPHAAAALLLAGGASRRMGGTPKSTLPVGARPSVDRMFRLSSLAGFAPVVVVAGPHAPEIRDALAGSDARIVENPDWAKGRTGSIQCGLRELDPSRPVLLWPVDHPFVEANTLRALRTAAEEDLLAVWVGATFRGHGGHPVLLKPPVLPSIGRLGPDEPLRTIPRALGPQVRRVPVDDFGVTASVETLEDYREGLAAWRARGGD